MPTILVQTTLAQGEGEWGIDRFSSLAALLRAEGHTVVARDREPVQDGSDPILSTLDASPFDELWLFAGDRGNGLAPQDVRGILRFRERGGGVFTSRDSENAGMSLLNLGSVGLVNHFRKYNRAIHRRRAHSPLVRGEIHTGSYQRITPLHPVHELLRSDRSPSGVIEHFPASEPDTALSVPSHAPFARVIAVSGDSDSGDTLNIAIAIEDERCHDGTVCGRAVATSCLHQFADDRWNAESDGPSEIFKDFLRNSARWLAR